jgi:hypothetical protein
MIIINPSLKDDALKSITRILPKDKIFTHIDQYFTDVTPGVAFENFLLQNFFVNSTFVENDPF